VFRKLRPSQLVVDLSVAAAAFLLRSAFGYYAGSGLANLVTVVVVLGMAATYAVHRLSPMLSLILAWATVILQLSFLQSPDLSNAAILVMLFATAAYGTARVRWLGLVSTGVGALVATVYVIGFNYVSSSDWVEFVSVIVGNLPRFTLLFVGGFAASLALFVLSWALGLLARSLRTTQQSRAAVATAEKVQREAERDVAIEQERNRIARDMHDVVAHSLAVVIAQADGARYAMKADPSTVDEALTTISGTAREALGDVRILLGQLRHNQTGAPQPALADLRRLFEQMRASGLIVEQETVGNPEPLGTSQQIAVFRIVQESLTNALRHGDRDEPVVVTFEWGAGTLELTVASAIGSAPRDPNKAGHGIDGMRERAVLAGGSFMAEEREGRFIVNATFAIVATMPVSVVRTS
jgi:signal transduction histidine kinase